jgi:hypothetical protein
MGTPYASSIQVAADAAAGCGAYVVGM